jgi:hypothetical protein
LETAARRQKVKYSFIDDVDVANKASILRSGYKTGSLTKGKNTETSISVFDENI